MAPAGGFGHSNNGINLTNYRLVSERNASKQNNPFRTSADWATETGRHVDMGVSQRRSSTSLRQSSVFVQAVTADQVLADISVVENSLKTKIRQTETLRDALQTTVAATQAEIEQCMQLKASLDQRLGKVQDKAQLNASRLQVRHTRPAREKTMDGVEGMLLRQQGLVSSFEDRVKRYIAAVERQVQQLEHCRVKLVADLRGKVEAIEVDSLTLNLQPGMTAAAGTAGLLPPASQLPSPKSKTTPMGIRMPHAWVQHTEETVREARKTITESVKLRKAVRHNVQDARAAEHEAARSLNQQMVAKISTTATLKKELERQLMKLQEEQTKVLAQRSSLVEAIEAKKGPLQQAQERLQARMSRPDNERVADDVQAALRAEIAHLKAMSSQLVGQLGAIDKTIDSLDISMLTIQDNIRDKETTLTVEERMALLDGRISVFQPPPTSIATTRTTSSAVSKEMQDAALQRIAELEKELEEARRERELLESNISHIKATLVQSPRGSVAA